MKLHILDVQAFGPFARRERIDFDELGADGLFLISGPTGAGKTSILDAICFALYGRVPGQRNDAHELRAQSAAPDVPTRVTLSFTARGHTYRVERGPTYERPAKRGGGTTLQRATASLFEYRDAEWAGLSRTNQEVSAMVHEAIGLSADQFTKIIMLPQGQFAQFLKAGPQEREPILQQLFGTTRFATVERLLAEGATQARARISETSGQRAAMVESALHGAGLSAGAVPVPQHPSAGDVMAGFAVALVELDERVDTADVVRDMAADRAEQAAETVDTMQRRIADREQLERLGQVEERLSVGAVEHARARSALAAHQSAEGMRSHVRECDRASVALQAARHAESDLVQAMGRAESALGLPESADVTDTAVQAAAVAAASLHHDMARADQLRERLSELSAQCEQRRGAVAEQDEALAHVTQQLDELTPQLVAPERLERARRDCAESQAAATQIQQRAAQLAAAHDALQRAHTDEQRQREREAADRAVFDRTRELRLAGIAAELAAQLEEGRACPVCGSPEHPAPSSPSAQDVTRAAEEQARQDWDAASARLQQASTARAEAQAAHSAAAAALGDDDPESAAQAAAVVRRQLDELTESAARLAGEEQKLTAEQQARRRALDTAQQQLADSERSRTEAQAALNAIVENSIPRQTAPLLAIGLEAPAETSASSRLAKGLDELLSTAHALQARRHEAEQAQSAWAQRQSELSAALAQSDFATAQHVREELEKSVGEDEELVRRYREDEIRAAQLREDPAVARAESDSAPSQDLKDGATRARQRHALAKARLDRASRAAAVVDSASVRLREERTGFINGLGDAERGLAQATEQVRLAELVQATTADNARRMSLSSYALLSRFVEVTENASQRLSIMTNGRYRLIHDVSLHKREKRAGLGLLIADEFTQARRDPRTLSGGESFMAALALALGLADTVAAHTGGIELDTLFIDEGFGSLDPDALAEVLGVLDELRAGGRTVGIISHVQSMQDAIASHLTVTPSPTGSTLSVALLG